MNNRSRKPSPEVSGHWKESLRQAPVARAGIPAPAAGAQSAGKRIRRRNVLVRYLIVSGFFGLVALVVWAAFETSSQVPVAEATAGPFTLDYATDGVIPEAYIKEIIGDSSRMPPIFDVKRKLEAVSQVKSVTVKRVSGDRLSVRITERRAVARFNALLDGRVVVRLVSSEGVIFKPINMGEGETVNGSPTALALRNMPVLTKFRTVAGADYDYIEGFSCVADFLDLARSRYPAFYGEWQQVSLADYAGRPEAIGAVIRVKPRLSAQAPDAAALSEIVFSPIDYAHELKWFHEVGGMDVIRGMLRSMDRAKFPVYLLDLSMLNSSNPHNTYPEPRLIPVVSETPAAPARSR